MESEMEGDTMKCKPMIWSVMTNRIKKGIKDVVPGEDAASLIKKAKPIYQGLLSKVDGISDENPMAGNITMSFVIIAVWLASDRRITPGQMSRIMESVLNWKPVKLMYGGVDMNTEKGVKATAQKLHQCADWAAAHPEDTGTWDFHFALFIMVAFVIWAVYGINGATGFWNPFWQISVLAMAEGLFDRFFIDTYWVGHTKAWTIPGTEDLKPYIPKKTLIMKWMIIIVGNPVIAAVISGIMFLFLGG